MRLGFPDTFKALSDPARREILLLLKQGRMTAGDIAEHLGLQNSKLSYHLAQLKSADLVFETKYKNYHYYELNTSVFETLMLWISQFMEREPDDEK